MLIIPLQAVPSQTETMPLSGQATQINVYWEDYGLFMDVLVDNAPIIQGVICENANRIVRDAYLGFIGDFFFLDTQGNSDPFPSGLGSRFQLCYATEAEFSSGVFTIGTP